MATTLYFRNTASPVMSNITSVLPKRMSTSRGAAATSQGRSSVAGTTTGILLITGATTYEWYSDPIDQDVTISGSITINLRMAESSMNANAGGQIEIARIGSGGSTAVLSLGTPERGVELGTSESAQNWSTTVTSQAFVKGDRIRVRVLFNDAGGTMASGHTLTFWWDGPTAAASGDSYITFTETFDFLSGTPSGHKLFLGSTDSDYTITAISVVEKKLLLNTHDVAVADYSRATANGFVSALTLPVQSGGTQVWWLTPPLQAVTVGGRLRSNIWALETNAGAEVGLSIAVDVMDMAVSETTPKATLLQAVLANEVTAVVYGVEQIDHGIDDYAILDGERIRIRISLDDNAANAMNAGFTAQVAVGATSDGAEGDTWFHFDQTFAEYSPPAARTPTSTQVRQLLAH